MRSRQFDVVGQEYQQQIAANVVGRRCPAGRKAAGRTNAQSLCARVSWKPKFGVAGPRRLQAIVSTRDVSPRTGVTLRLQSGRPDLRFSPAKGVRLLPGKLYAGPPQLKKAKVPTPCESI